MPDGAVYRKTPPPMRMQRKSIDMDIRKGEVVYSVLEYAFHQIRDSADWERLSAEDREAISDYREMLSLLSVQDDVIADSMGPGNSETPLASKIDRLREEISRYMESD